MSREIKFRAWDPYNRIMYAPTRDEDALLGPSYELALWDGGWEMTSTTASGKRPVVASQTRSGEAGGILMQYTGLKDKHGVEIYERDVVKPARAMTASREVVVSQGQFILQGSLVSLYGEYSINDSLEVIGNIYENPELLEAQS